MKKCVCGEEMTPAEWKNQWVCHRCGRTKPMRTTVTNADRIRAMSDEEIAEYVCHNSFNTLCDIICGGEGNAIATLKKAGGWAGKEIVMKWLQQPAEDDENGV